MISSQKKIQAEKPFVKLAISAFFVISSQAVFSQNRYSDLSEVGDSASLGWGWIIGVLSIVGIVVKLAADSMERENRQRSGSEESEEGYTNNHNDDDDDDDDDDDRYVSDEQSIDKPIDFGGHKFGGVSATEKFLDGAAESADSSEDEYAEFRGRYPETAFPLLRRLHDGDGEAGYDLYRMFRHGLGVQADSENAVSLLELGASVGNKKCQREFGTLLLGGDPIVTSVLGVDIPLAYAWLSVARDRGCSDLEETLVAIKGKLTREEVHRANELYRSIGLRLFLLVD